MGISFNLHLDMGVTVIVADSFMCFLKPPESTSCMATLANNLLSELQAKYLPLCPQISHPSSKKNLFAIIKFFVIVFLLFVLPLVLEAPFLGLVEVPASCENLVKLSLLSTQVANIVSRLFYNFNIKALPVYTHGKISLPPC